MEQKKDEKLESFSFFYNDWMESFEHKFHTSLKIIGLFNDALIEVYFVNYFENHQRIFLDSKLCFD